MKARSKLSPGQPGTRKLTKLYGERLVCVRYRYDEEKKCRYTTAEIIVDEQEWIPRIKKIDLDMLVKIGFEEQELREKVRGEGGRWDRGKKRWVVKMEVVKRLGLEDRMEVEKVQ